MSSHLTQVLEKHTNNGYAFVHLQTQVATQALIKEWQGKHPFGYKFGPSIDIALASVQGAKENIAMCNRGKMARIRNKHFRPLILKDVGLSSAPPRFQ